jgi:RNA polymerase sigma-70 factor (ECF subfamily)
MMIVCLRYARNLEEAEEILQDGFLRVFRFLYQFKNEGSLEGWIRKIMVNCALHKLKNQHLRPIVAFDGELHNPSIDNDIIEKISSKELLIMIQTLSPAYRMVFNLYYFEGLKHREIAKLLDITEGTSKSNLAQARRILQNLINDHSEIVKNIHHG